MRPSLILDFANTKRLDPRITYTNASGNRSYFDATGALKYAGVNEPIFDHDPITGRSLGLGSFEARTNIVLQSSALNITRNVVVTGGAGTFVNGETVTTSVGGVGVYEQSESSSTVFALSGSSGTFTGTLTGGTSGATRTISSSLPIWTATNTTVTANTTTAPDGTLTADTVYGVAGGTLAYSSTGSIGLAYTGSFYIKRKTGSGEIAIRNVENINTPITVTNEWTRVTDTKTATTTTIRFGLRFAVTGDEVYVWGGQQEVGSLATPYTPTTVSTVTRSADVNSQTVDINPLEGSAVCRFIGNAVGTCTYWGLSDGTANERIYLQSIAGALTLKVVDGGSEQCSLSLGSIVSGTAYTVAAAWKLNDFAASINGAAVVTDSAGTLPTVTTLKEGMDYSNANHANSTIARVVLFSRRLSNSTLQGLAT